MFNRLEKAIAYVSPSWAMRRESARHVIRAYEAAKPTRTFKPKREANAADVSVQIAGKSLREQARWLDNNHDIVTGLFDRLEERVVGGAGIGVEPVPISLTGEVHLEFAAQIKAAWAEWSLKPETAGELTRPQVERMICRTWLRDGEALAQKVQGRVAGYQHLTKVPFALEILEPDYLPLDYNDASKGILQGIERGDWRRIKAFHLHRNHPATVTGYRYGTKSVPAENMIFIASRKRIGQNRGVSILHSALIRIAEIKDYEESERVAARISAALAMYIKKGEPDMYNVEARTGDRTFPLAPGTVFDGLQPGEEVGTIESNRPNTFLEGFRNGQLRTVAASTRMAYSTLARNYNGTYSAQRQELVEAQLGYDQLQHDFIDFWCRPVYRSWLAMAIASGVIEIPVDVDQNSIFSAVYQGPVMPWIDPLKEAVAWETLVKAAFSTESEVARARGLNPQELKKTRIAEIEQNRAAGLVFSSDHYHDHKPEQPMSLVEAVQKVYLGVGKALTSDEAREILNQYGAGLSVPGPDFEQEQQGGQQKIDV